MGLNLEVTFALFSVLLTENEHLYENRISLTLTNSLVKVILPVEKRFKLVYTNNQLRFLKRKITQLVL